MKTIKNQFWINYKIQNLISKIDKIIITMHAKTIHDDDDGFRNKGTLVLSGKIIKGTMNEAPIKLNVSSIPSKYENVIYKSSSKPAFGDSTQKFFQLTNDSDLVPGPGNYNLDKSYSKIDSKKGSGFFASQTKLDRLERARSHIPGPGTYKTFNVKPKKLNKKQKNSMSSSILNSSSSTAIMSSHFQARNLFKSQIDNSATKPSVGAYQLNPEKLTKSKSAYSTFKSKIERFKIKTRQVPPVGYYDASQQIKHLNAVTKKTQNIREDSDTQRQIKLKKAIRNLQAKQSKEKLGPGVYEVKLSKTTKSFKIKETIYDRFGQLKPIYRISSTAAMEGGENEEERTNIFPRFNPSKTYNSIFKSTTSRPDWKLTNQMDPGSYNGSKSPNKKSHLINFMQKWV